MHVCLILAPFFLSVSPSLAPTVWSFISISHFNPPLIFTCSVYHYSTSISTFSSLFEAISMHLVGRSLGDPGLDGKMGRTSIPPANIPSFDITFKRDTFSRTYQLFKQILEAAHVKVMDLNNRGKLTCKKKKILAGSRSPVDSSCMFQCENENAVKIVAVIQWQVDMLFRVVLWRHGHVIAVQINTNHWAVSFPASVFSAPVVIPVTLTG